MDAVAIISVIGGVATGIVFIIAMAAVIIVPSVMKNRNRQRVQDIVRASIERGDSLSPDIIQAMTRDARPEPSAYRDRRRGVIWLAIAIGILGIGVPTWWYRGDAYGQFIGLAAIPFAIGVAFILLSFINPKP